MPYTYSGMSETQLPVGEAAELGKIAQGKQAERLAVFSQVKNKVLAVNPEVNIPLKLEEGKPSPLGLFAEAAYSTEDSSKRKFEVWYRHGRSALLGRLIFSDEEGRLFRDIDVKGIGVVEVAPGDGVTIGEHIHLGEEGPFGGRQGLLDREVAEKDYQDSEDFVKAGIRTSRTLAIIELEELVLEGRKISLTAAREKGIIDQSFQPVVEVRAFGTKARIIDANYSNVPLIEDAKLLVAQELGRTEPLSDEEYLNWFARTLGENVARMHKAGWAHGYLTHHNITLDCRIVDLDSVEDLVREGDRDEDYQEAGTTLFVLAWKVKVAAAVREGKFFGDIIQFALSSSERSQLWRKFEESYDSTFPPQEREEYFRQLPAEEVENA